MKSFCCYTTHFFCRCRYRICIRFTTESYRKGDRTNTRRFIEHVRIRRFVNTIRIFPANCFCNVLGYVRKCQCYDIRTTHGRRCLSRWFYPDALVQIIPKREKLSRFVTFDVFGRRVYIRPRIARTISTLDFKVYTEVPVVGRFIYARLCCRRKVR